MKWIYNLQAFPQSVRHESTKIWYAKGNLRVLLTSKCKRRNGFRFEAQNLLNCRQKNYGNLFRTTDRQIIFLRNSLLVEFLVITR